jgi:two-component system response regulator
MPHNELPQTLPSASAHTILLVEDNEDDEALTLRAFRRSKIFNHVVIARTGEEALDFLFNTGPYSHRDPTVLPMITLLDLNLPKIDGFEVLRQIRAHERTKRLRVVVLTSCRQDEDLVRCETTTANAYLRKPINFAEFADTITPLGVRWLLRDSQPRY